MSVQGREDTKRLALRSLARFLWFVRLRHPLQNSLDVMTRLFFAFSLALALLSSGISAHGAPSGASRISFAKVALLKGAPGDTLWVDVVTTIEKGSYTYSTRHIEGPDGIGPQETQFALADAKIGRILSAVRSPKPKVVFDEGFEVNIEKLQGTFIWSVPIRLAATLKPGVVRTVLNVQAQLCDSTMCLPQSDYPVPLEIEITKAVRAIEEEEVDTAATVSRHTDQAAASTGAAPGKGDENAEVVDAQREIEREKAKGLLNFFFYAMGVGFLALLTPCVFPMIPITVSFFTKRDQSKRFAAVRDAGLFGIGIISTFTLIGIVMSIAFGPTVVQNMAANPWLNFMIAGLFLVLAFNLFGAFEIQIPVGIMNRLNKKTQGTGVASIFMMGLVFSLTSFTCTVPFVGTILIGAANKGEYLFPTIGMLGFATAFALPFFFLALFPSMLSALPRAGGWMNNMKVVMGFIEIAAAVKFISTAEFVLGWGILPREPFLAIWSGVFILTALYLLGVFRMKLDTPLESVSALRAIFAVMFITTGLWFAAGMMGRPLASDIEALLPPDNYRAIIDGIAHSDEWFTDFELAKAEAKRSGKPLFIDFTGRACTNCRLMEKDVFTKEPVKDVFKKFVLVQLYTDTKEEQHIRNQKIMQEFGTVANPLYVLLRPDGSYIAQTGYLPKYRGNPADFIAFLQQAHRPL
jgi:thiol:disulfide interchange protein